MYSRKKKTKNENHTINKVWEKLKKKTSKKRIQKTIDCHKQCILFS